MAIKFSATYDKATCEDCHHVWQTLKTKTQSNLTCPRCRRHDIRVSSLLIRTEDVKAKPIIKRNVPFVQMTQDEQIIECFAPRKLPPIIKRAHTHTHEKQNETINSIPLIKRAHIHEKQNEIVIPVVRSLSDNIKSKPHIVVDALAGTGKTFTEIEQCYRLCGINRNVVGSDEQEAIWSSIPDRYSPTDIIMASFGYSAAEQLKAKAPPHVIAGTIHKFGKRVLAFDRIGTGRYGVQFKKTLILMSKVHNCTLHNLFNQFKKQTPLLYTISQFVSFLKLNLCTLSGDYEQDIALLHGLADIHGYLIPDMKTESDKQFVYSHVFYIFEKSHQVLDIIDYDDMLYLPWKLGSSIRPVPFMFVDERQDLNKAQQELVSKLGTRLFIAGDYHQAIYAFAGADKDACVRMEERLSSSVRGLHTFPLTYTRRCGKAIVEYAQQIVPEFKYFPDAPDGKVSKDKEANYIKKVECGDMVVCRTNAPLFGACLQLLTKGIPFKTTVCKFFKRTVDLIESLNATSLGALDNRLDEWKEAQLDGCNESRSDRRITIIDTVAAIKAEMGVCSTISELIRKINSLFKSDDEEERSPNVGKDWVFLTSIHGAKGLEADRVWWLQYDLVPHPKAQLIEQEDNLRWVACTRARHELVLVRSTPKKRGEDE